MPNSSFESTQKPIEEVTQDEMTPEEIAIYRADLLTTSRPGYGNYPSLSTSQALSLEAWQKINASLTGSDTQ